MRTIAPLDTTAFLSDLCYLCNAGSRCGLVMRFAGRVASGNIDGQVPPRAG